MFTQPLVSYRTPWPALPVWMAVLLTGCGGPPAANQMLAEAESAFRAVETDPDVVRNAPVALQEAEEALQRARAIWAEKASKEDVDHHAYLAMQHVRIAEETARLNIAEKEVKRAEVERKEVVLELRTREAERAEEEARRAREEAEEAINRARQLAAQLTELEAKKTARGIVLTLSDVLFDTNRADLKANSVDMILQLADYLMEYPERNVLIEGFTDSTGPHDYNMDLSLRRAQAVRDALVQRGVSPDRIRVRGFGENFPVAGNDTPYGRQQNRRVEIVISNEDGVIPERTH